MSQSSLRPSTRRWRSSATRSTSSPRRKEHQLRHRPPSSCGHSFICEVGSGCCRPVGTVERRCRPVGTVERRCRPVGTVERRCRPVGTVERHCRPVGTVERRCRPVGTVERRCRPVGTVERRCRPVGTVERRCRPVGTVEQHRPRVRTVPVVCGETYPRQFNGLARRPGTLRAPSPPLTSRHSRAFFGTVSQLGRIVREVGRGSGGLRSQVPVFTRVRRLAQTLL